MLEWAVPEDGDVDDPVNKANPASWLKVDDLRQQREAVPDLAHRRYHANQWTAIDGHWLPPGAGQACVARPAFRDGEDVWIGVDVGGERSATAVAWVNAELHVGAAIYPRPPRACAAPDHPGLAQHAAQAIARHSRRGWRIDRPGPRVHIDALIALCMAVGRAEHQVEPAELLGWL